MVTRLIEGKYIKEVYSVVGIASRRVVEGKKIVTHHVFTHVGRA